MKFVRTCLLNLTLTVWFVSLGLASYVTWFGNSVSSCRLSLVMCCVQSTQGVLGFSFFFKCRKKLYCLTFQLYTFCMVFLCERRNRIDVTGEAVRNLWFDLWEIEKFCIAKSYVVSWRTFDMIIWILLVFCMQLTASRFLRWWLMMKMCGRDSIRDCLSFWTYQFMGFFSIIFLYFWLPFSSD